MKGQPTGDAQSTGREVVGTLILTSTWQSDQVQTLLSELVGGPGRNSGGDKDEKENASSPSPDAIDTEELVLVEDESGCAITVPNAPSARTCDGYQGGVAFVQRALQLRMLHRLQNSGQPQDKVATTHGPLGIGAAELFKVVPGGAGEATMGAAPTYLLDAGLTIRVAPRKRYTDLVYSVTTQSAVAAIAAVPHKDRMVVQVPVTANNQLAGTTRLPVTLEPVVVAGRTTYVADLGGSSMKFVLRLAEGDNGFGDSYTGPGAGAGAGAGAMASASAGSGSNEPCGQSPALSAVASKERHQRAGLRFVAPSHGAVGATRRALNDGASAPCTMHPSRGVCSICLMVSHDVLRVAVLLLRRQRWSPSSSRGPSLSRPRHSQRATWRSTCCASPSCLPSIR